MRRALTFFIIATALFLISQTLILLVGGGSEMKAGIFSIFIALIYAAFPVFSTKVLAFLPQVPLYVLVASLSVAGFLLFLSIVIFEFVFPAILGYFIMTIAYQEFKMTGAMLTVIGFITVWLLIRKYQWRLIGGTWEFANKLYNLIVKPIVNLLERISEEAEKIGESIRR